jgi:hypothetical protein
VFLDLLEMPVKEIFSSLSDPHTQMLHHPVIKGLFNLYGLILGVV